MIDELKDDSLYKSIFQSSVEGILVIDDCGVIIKANPASEQMFGYNTSELIQKKVEYLIPNKFRNNYKFHKLNYTNNPKEKRIGLDLDLWALKKDGSQFPLEISLTPTLINGKNATIGFLRNATTHKQDLHKIQQVNSDLLESNRKFETLINNQKGIVFSCKNNRDYEMEYLSEGCLELTGYNFQAFKKHEITYGQLIFEEDRNTVWKQIQHAVKQKKPYSLEYRIKHKNGTIKYVWEKGKAIFNDKNEVVVLEGFISDLTFQKETEQKLRFEKNQNKAILQAIPDLIFVNNRQGVYIDVHTSNPSDLFLPKDEIIDKTISTALPKEIFEKIMSAFANYETTKKTQIIEYSLPIMDELQYFEARIVGTEDGNFLTIVRNITKKTKTEKILKENEERLRLAVDAGGFGLWEWNLITNTIKRDPFQITLFGKHLEKETITQELFFDMVYPDDKATIKSKVSEAIQKTSDYLAEYRVVHSDKSIHWLKTKGKVFKDVNGKPLQMIGVTHDITEQKKAEQKLKESEEKLRDHADELKAQVKERTKELTTTVQKLVESNLNFEDQILVTKATENEVIQSRFLLDNISKNFPKGFVAVCDSNFNLLLVEGEEVDELGFKGLASAKTLIDDVEGVPHDVKEKVKRKVLKTFKGEHCSFEVEYQNRTYLINSTPLYNAENKINQVLMVHNNITHQKETELEVLNTLKREQELSELKSRFISMASHEFRTPLSAILTSAILIDKQNEAGKEEKRLHHVSKIKSNVQNLVVILNDFLSLSKLEEGKVVAKPQVFDFIDFSKSLIDEIKVNKKNGQTIIFKCEPSKLKVFLDPKLVRHIVYNLLSNAIKYSEENKKITYKINTNHHHLLLEVSDQGIGIPEEEKNNMFQRFYRADNVINIQGTGLGLNIVKQYTELMGGSITFKSELNVGSTFYVEFPLNTN